MDTTPLVVDVREAARLLNMLPARVTRLANRGLLPCVKLPDGELRFSVEDLRAWIAAHRQPARGARP